MTLEKLTLVFSVSSFGCLPAVAFLCARSQRLRKPVKWDVKQMSNESCMQPQKLNRKTAHNVQCSSFAFDVLLRLCLCGCCVLVVCAVATRDGWLVSCNTSDAALPKSPLRAPKGNL